MEFLLPPCRNISGRHLSILTGIFREREISPHVTAVYDRQRWACIHEDEISDKLVQEKAFGLFANAYLAVASKGAGSSRQYLQNTTAPEKEDFQIRTAILEENGKRYVEKTALTAAAEAHIRSMREKYEKLISVNPASKGIRATLFQKITRQSAWLF